MVLETLISSKYRIVTIVTLAILAAGLLGQLISSAIWWSRLQPWFGYGRGYYRVVYNCVFACFILSLVAFVVLVVVGAINIFAKELYAKLTGSLLGTTLVITIVGACALAGLIPGAYGASWAVDRYKVPTIEGLPNQQLESLLNLDADSFLSIINSENPQDQAAFAQQLQMIGPFKDSLDKFNKDANAHFCAGYVSGIAEIEEKNDWSKESQKFKDYEKWKGKLAGKALETVMVTRHDGNKLSLENYIRHFVNTVTENKDLNSNLTVNFNIDLNGIPDPIPDLPNSYLCEQVGLPTLIFTMITALSMIVFFYLIVFNAYNQSDASEAEA